MKGIFSAILISAPLAAIVLWFALLGKEEVKNEVRVQEAVKAVDKQHFDDQFTDAFNGMTNDPEDRAKILKQRNERLADLEAVADKAKAKRDHLDQLFDDAERDMTEAIKEEGARLSKEGLEKKKANPVQ